MMLLFIQPSARPEIPWSMLWGILVAAATLGLSYLHMYMTERNRKLYAPLQPLYDDRGNPCWATKPDMDRLGAKVNGVQDQVAHVDEKAKKNASDIDLIRQAQLYVQQDVVEKLGHTAGILNSVTARLEAIASEQARVGATQQAQAEQLRIILNRRNDT